LAWPGWEAVMDGLPVDIYPAASSGLITFSVPSGRHTVELRLTRTPVRVTAEIVSLAAVLITGMLFWPAIRRNANRKRLGWAGAGIVMLVLLSIGLQLWPAPTLSPDTLSWDFEQLGYLHHSPDGIPFEGDLLLRRYTYSQDAVNPGEEISIVLAWENGNGTTAEMALMTPAVQRIETAPILTAQSQIVQSGEVVYRLAIPRNAPAGLYVPRLTVAGARSLTDSGQVRGDLFLRPIRVLDGGQPATANESALGVRAVDVVYQTPDVLLAQLQWLTLQPLSANYNVSLRLVDDVGLVVAHQDAQPGFGYLPSSGWLPGRWEDDWLTLTLPDDFSAELANPTPYALVVRLYDVETEAVVLIRRLGEMIWEGDRLVFREAPALVSVPEGFAQPLATFEETIRLEWYTLEQTAESLDLTLIWHALEDIPEDFFHFVHLVDPATGDIVAQHDSMPRNDTYPTSQWGNSEIVADRLRIALAAVPPGEYLLYVGLYRNEGSAFPPLAAVEGREGRPLAGNRVLLETIVIGGEE
jgi:hypothetical protein